MYLVSALVTFNLQIHLFSSFENFLNHSPNIEYVIDQTMATEPVRRGYCMVKRIFDIIVSLIALILFAPILLLCVIAIKLDSRGPVFFIQKRTGLNGDDFPMIKLRGMVVNAESMGPALTQKDDPRLTRIGKILRRTSVDEIPQVINVLRGEMSIVGPRPEVKPITALYSDEQRKVFRYKPGITGISQVNGRQTLSPEERIQMEVEYYKSASFWTDIKIILRTPFIVITNQGNI